MAFTGVAVIDQVADNLFRITGLSLIADASGTIGFSDKTVAPEVELIAPTWQPYQNGDQVDVSLQDAIEVRMVPVTDVSAAVPVSVVKTGTDHGDFVITFHNDNAAEGQVSAELEIYIEFHS
jgi:hypothetical protein